jgi:hypothetical protein
MTAHAWIPDSDARAALNAELLATGHDSGFWDDNGGPAPWPDDIEEWSPSTREPVTHQPDEPAF